MKNNSSQTAERAYRNSSDFAKNHLLPALDNKTQKLPQIQCRLKEEEGEE